MTILHHSDNPPVVGKSPGRVAHDVSHPVVRPQPIHKCLINDHRVPVRAGSGRKVPALDQGDF